MRFEESDDEHHHEPASDGVFTGVEVDKEDIKSYVKENFDDIMVDDL